MSTFLLLECMHYIRARGADIEPFTPTHCPKCSREVMIAQVHNSSFKVVCKECTYRRKFGSNRAAYGAADRHYQQTGHDPKVLVMHPALPLGATYIAQARRQKQLELPIPF